MLTINSTILEKILQDSDIIALSLWNLEESGGTAGSNACYSTTQRVYLRREVFSDVSLVDFPHTLRVTMMPVVSDDCDTKPALFVFKSEVRPSRTALRDRVIYTETYASLLPRNNIVAVCEKFGVADSDKFFVWAQKFVQSVCDLNLRERKALLTYHRHRSHMSLQVLWLLYKKSIIAYVLPENPAVRCGPFWGH